MKLQILFFALLMGSTLQAQVALNAVVEHFTNTKCGICASKNPSLNANLAQHPEVSHLSIHPSSPYDDCYLSELNATANDARTEFYDLYGGTPRIVLNGSIVNPSTQYNSPTLFDAGLDLTTPYEIKIQQQKFSDDSIRIRVVVKKISSAVATDALLFVGVVEDTVIGNGGNGEIGHYDVLRRAVTAAAGLSVSLSATIGDSIVADYVVATNAAWDIDRIYSMAILQRSSNKAVLQSNKTTVTSTPFETVSGVFGQQNKLDIQISPNPTSGEVLLSLVSVSPSQVFVYDIQGGLVASQNFERSTMVDLGSQPAGMYVLRVVNAGETAVRRVVRL